MGACVAFKFAQFLLDVGGVWQQNVNAVEPTLRYLVIEFVIEIEFEKCCVLEKTAVPDSATGFLLQGPRAKCGEDGEVCVRFAVAPYPLASCGELYVEMVCSQIDMPI